MMLNKLLTVATAILLPGALAIPTSGAPSDPQAPPQGVSPRVAEALTTTTKTVEFAAGRCQFWALISELCDSSVSGNTTIVGIPNFLDNAGKVIIDPADGLPVSVEAYYGLGHTTGLDQDFWVSAEDGVVSCK